jgi:hypothetical protein
MKTKNDSIGSVVKSNNSVIAKLQKYQNADIQKKTKQILAENWGKCGYM